jgi:hypothetical protein
VGGIHREFNEVPEQEHIERLEEFGARFYAAEEGWGERVTGRPVQGPRTKDGRELAP